MGAWSCVLETTQGDPIPVKSDPAAIHDYADAFDFQSYYFARDDRVYKAFQERVRANKDSIARTCTKRLKWQMRVLDRVMDGRTITYRVCTWK